MRRAFTLIELMICVAIVAIIAAIAIPNIVQQSIVGKYAVWRGQKVFVVARDMKTQPITYVIRISTNVDAHALEAELTPYTPTEDDR